MKIFIAFLLIFASFSDAKPFGIDDAIIAPHFASPTTDVSVHVTWTFYSETKVTSVAMVVKNLQAAQWAGIGLGQNISMGEAHVFICKRLADNTIVLQRYINPEDHHYPEPAGSEQGGVLTPGQQTLVDGVVTCRFNLSNFATTPYKGPNALRPLSQSDPYHPLFGVGLLNTTNNIPQRHSDDSHTVLVNTVQLNMDEVILYKLTADEAGAMKKPKFS